MKTKREEFLENVAAVKNETSETLGYLAWYSIGDALYQRTELKRNIAACGIDEKYLPNEVRPSDAYRRATKDVELKRFRENETDKLYRNFIVRDVVSNGKKLQRNIVIETVNQEGERLDYDTEGAMMYFDKEGDKFTIIANDLYAEELAEQAQLLYEQYLNAHNGNTVRGSITKIVHTLSPVAVRPSGGVFFVPFKYKDQLRNLVDYICSLEKGEAHMIPLISNDENKSMVSGKVAEQITKLLTQCRNALSDDSKLKNGQIVAIVDEARRAVAQYKDYKELLNDTIAGLDSSVEMLRIAIGEVMQKDQKKDL